MSAGARVCVSLAEADDLAEAGFEPWLMDGDADLVLVDPAEGTAVRWRPDAVWTEIGD
ncbi:MAG TPA: hypothetical protein VNB06_14000 [Thermoanaerobaculia bacterium]|nr:hypothetical protein [Thermoanaerobaculia bacterium]